jgi:hypothetical protein
MSDRGTGPRLAALVHLLDHASARFPPARYVWGVVVLAAVVALIRITIGLNQIAFVALLASFAALLLFYIFGQIGKTTHPVIKWSGLALLAATALAYVAFILLTLSFVSTCWPPVLAHLYGFAEVCKASPDAMRGEENLPGFSTYTLFQPNDLNELRRKYYFSFEDPEHAKTALYLSASNVFTFSVTDVNGESYPLEIPLGSYDGIPIDKFAVAVFEVGVATNYAFMRAVVNGREVAHRSLPPIDLGSRQWRASSIGSGPMMFVEVGAWFTTMTDEEIDALTKNVRARYGVGK